MSTEKTTPVCHPYRLLVTRLPDGRIGIETFDSAEPLYSFRCPVCGDVERATLQTAVERGWVEALDVSIQQSSPGPPSHQDDAELAPCPCFLFTPGEQSDICECGDPLEDHRRGKECSVNHRLDCPLDHGSEPCPV